jgi:hypothetical protein
MKQDVCLDGIIKYEEIALVSITLSLNLNFIDFEV